jgi:hypothetical protein
MEHLLGAVGKDGDTGGAFDPDDPRRDRTGSIEAVEQGKDTVVPTETVEHAGVRIRHWRSPREAFRDPGP